MKIVLCLLGIFAAAICFADEAAAPEVPLEIQNKYLRELAVYSSINADMQEARARAEADKGLLAEEEKKVSAAKAAVASSCPAGFVLDDKAFRQGTMTCVKAETPPKAAAEKGGAQ